MHSRTAAIVVALVGLTVGTSIAEDRLPPIKLDKNLRRALLKALADLDAESAEQKVTETRDIIDFSNDETNNTGNDRQTTNQRIQGSIFSFEGFPSDEETPSEDKLQNSTYVEIDKYVGSESGTMRTNESSENNDRNNETAFHDVPSPEKLSAIHGYPESRTSVERNTSDDKPSSINNSKSLAPSNGIVAPGPTSPIVPIEEKTKSELTNDQVKIFQAPLVAAFTVQQDERGVPKSVVPIYRPSGDGLTLQEQLDFKQQLLERQLAELQAQQIHQTQFLVRQRQIYEQQLRQKQQQRLFIEEQSRLKRLQEEQRNYQLLQQQQQLNAVSQHLAQNGFKTPGSTVNVQPSLTLELPKSPLLPFQSNYHEQLRIQQRRQLQQNQQRQLLQQRLQQSFPSFPIDFQPPTSGPAVRFNREEAFGVVGNFGINDVRQQAPNRNNFGYTNQLVSRGPQTFTYNNPYHQQQQQYRQQRPQTPAKQIQHLLFQSGVAGDLGTVQGTGGQEDLNIVSKVLALNVGALPATKNLRYNNFANSANSA